MKTIASLLAVSAFCLLSTKALVEEHHFSSGAAGYTLEEDPYGYILKTPDDRPVFRYMTQVPEDSGLSVESACCLYPVSTPRGVNVVDFAPDDHPHHRGIFFAFHNVTTPRGRADWWGWGQFAPTEGRRIVNDSVELVNKVSGQNKSNHPIFAPVLCVSNMWKLKNLSVFREETQIRVDENDGRFVLEFQIRLTALLPATLERSPFGGLCAKGVKAEGAVIHPVDVATNTPRPRAFQADSPWRGSWWYSYTFPSESGKAGFAIINSESDAAVGWYNTVNNGQMNPSPVAWRPIHLAAGETIEFTYRIDTYDGEPEVSDFNSIGGLFSTD